MRAESPNPHLVSMRWRPVSTTSRRLLEAYVDNVPKNRTQENRSALRQSIQQGYVATSATEYMQRFIAFASEQGRL